MSNLKTGSNSIECKNGALAKRPTRPIREEITHPIPLLNALGPPRKRYGASAVLQKLTLLRALCIKKKPTGRPLLPGTRTASSLSQALRRHVPAPTHPHPPTTPSYAEAHGAPPLHVPARPEGEEAAPQPGSERRQSPGAVTPRVLTVQVFLLGPHDLVRRGLADGFGDRRAGHAVLSRRDAVGEALAGHGGAGRERGAAPSSGAGTGGLRRGMELNGFLAPPRRRRPPLRPQGRTCHPSRDPSSSSHPPPPTAVPSPCAFRSAGDRGHTLGAAGKWRQRGSSSELSGRPASRDPGATPT